MRVFADCSGKLSVHSTDILGMGIQDVTTVQASHGPSLGCRLLGKGALVYRHRCQLSKELGFIYHQQDPSFKDHVLFLSIASPL